MANSVDSDQISTAPSGSFCILVIIMKMLYCEHCCEQNNVYGSCIRGYLEVDMWH